MSGKSILIIDDAADIRLLVRKILEADGANVAQASTISAGLAQAKQTPPHLIILDLELTDATGFDFLRARKADKTLLEIPVIILSGRSDLTSAQEAIALGANDYTLKPFRATLLIQKVKKALRLTSFLSKSVSTPASFTIDAELTEIGEGGCTIEAPVRLSADEKVSLTGEVLQRLGAQNFVMKALPYRGKYKRQGRYLNRVTFVGMNQDLAKKIRAILKDFK